MNPAPGPSAPRDGEAPRSVAGGGTILIVGMNYAPEMTGVGRYTGELGSHLAGRGCRVVAVTAPPHYPAWSIPKPFRAWAYSAETREGVRVIRCPLVVRRRMGGLWRLIAPFSFAISSAPVVLWRALSERPDVVLCIEPSLCSAPAALLAARLAGARAVLHVQDLEVDAAFSMGHLRHGWLRRLAFAGERALLRRFGTVVTISGRMAERLVAKGVPAGRIALVRNWVDVERIRPRDGPNPYRRELAIEDDVFIVLYAGSIGAKQALHVVLDAATGLRDRRDILFVIAGDGPAKARLIQLYAALENVRFIDLQPEERLPELLTLPDLHVLPQEAGAADLVLPSKIGGMLASGKPILATADVGTELHDFLKGAAILVPAGDAAGIGREIGQLAGKPAGGSMQAGIRLAARLDKRRVLAEFEQILSGARPPASMHAGGG